MGYIWIQKFRKKNISHDDYQIWRGNPDVNKFLVKKYYYNMFYSDLENIKVVNIACPLGIIASNCRPQGSVYLGSVYLSIYLSIDHVTWWWSMMNANQRTPKLLVGQYIDYWRTDRHVQTQVRCSLREHETRTYYTYWIESLVI